mmetsp:Transcript_4912/g.9920  ORF Transcript_4912/g.9920 Transcript_4912/m.9920 type:complete len:92 (-) Transcript_4912:819-1094(-)
MGTRRLFYGAQVSPSSCRCTELEFFTSHSLAQGLLVCLDIPGVEPTFFKRRFLPRPATLPLMLTRDHSRSTRFASNTLESLKMKIVSREVA